MDPKTTASRSLGLDQSGSVDRDDTLLNASSEVPAFDAPIGTGEAGTLGPYRIVKELGRGGMGAVYAAIDTRLDRRLALKVMLPQYAANPTAKERFLREARAAARIKHDHVVTVYEADERNGVPYIAMEFLEGYPLDEYIRKKGNPSISQILRIGSEMAAGLGAAHNLGLVHRDIKPGNLWLEAPKGRVKVLDFGLAKPVDGEVELTRSGAVVGTPAYMSPEQAKGERVDARSDLFSLGAVLYRLCTGRLPFQGATTMAMLMALGTEEPKPVRELNPEVPESLATLIHQLLAKRADARPQSAAEVETRLQFIAAELAVPQDLPVEQSTSLPQVVYVPIQVSMAPSEANPFADIDVSATELQAASAAPAPAEKSVRKKPGSFPWLLTGALGFAALVLGGVIIIIKNKDGTETKIEVPDGATVTIKGNGGKTLAKVGPVNAPPAAPSDADRKAAEWVLSLGGNVKVNGNDTVIKDATALPRDRFTLSTVNLTTTQVTDAELAQLKELKKLTTLALGDTQVTDTGLAHIKEIKSLAELYLNKTKVSDAGMAHLKELNNLKHLNLDATQVTGTGLAQLRELEKLSSLTVSGANVTDTGLAQLKELKNLTQLNLSGTKVTDTGLAQLKELKNLTHLNLHGTQVTDTGLALLKELKNLTQLYLSDTKVTDAGLAHIKELKNLTQLYLSDTQVTDAGMAHIKELKNLQLLNLSGTKVTGTGLAQLKELKKLHWLSLIATQVTDTGLAQLKELKNLGQLLLCDTQVTDAGMAHLKELNNLKQLYLLATKVTAKGLADFHAAVPGCWITHDGGVIEPKK